MDYGSLISIAAAKSSKVMPGGTERKPAFYVEKARVKPGRFKILRRASKESRLDPPGFGEALLIICAGATIIDLWRLVFSIELERD